MKKIEILETENNKLKFDQINEKKIIELKYKEMNNEIENLTKNVENGSSKLRRIEQQLKNSEEDSSDKESKYQQLRQNMKILQNKFNENENELFNQQNKNKIDNNGNVRLIENLEGQLKSLKAAKATIESLLLSASDEDDTLHGDLLAKLSNLQQELSIEKTKNIEKERLFIELNENKNEIQSSHHDLLSSEKCQNEKGKDMELLQLHLDLEKNKKLLSKCELELELNEKKLQNLNILNSDLQASDLLSKGSIRKLENSLDFVTNSNSNLKTESQHQKDEILHLKEEVRTYKEELSSHTVITSQLQQKLTQSEKQLKLSVEEIYKITEQLEREKTKNISVKNIEKERDDFEKITISLQEKVNAMEMKISKLELKVTKSKISSQNISKSSAELDLLNEKIENLIKENESLKIFNTTINENQENQTTVLETLQTKHHFALLEIESMSLQLRATSSDSTSDTEKLRNDMQQYINKEKVIHQASIIKIQDDLMKKENEIQSLKETLKTKARSSENLEEILKQRENVLFSLEDNLKVKESEIRILKAERTVRPRSVHEILTATSMSPSMIALGTTTAGTSKTAAVAAAPGTTTSKTTTTTTAAAATTITAAAVENSNDSAGIKALSVIVEQQQSSFQRLEEKLQSAEDLISALSKALPSQNIQIIDGKDAKNQGKQESHRNYDKNEECSPGESERKYFAAVGVTSPIRQSDKNEQKNINIREKVREKDSGMFSQSWNSSDDDDSKPSRAHGLRTRPKGEVSQETKGSRSKIPRMETQSPVKTFSVPIVRSPRRKEKQKEKPQGAELELEIWALKIVREDRFLCDLTATLKDEKMSVRKEQESLGRRRSAWRAKKAQNSSDSASRAQLREVSNDLNAQTTRLNEAVEQTRVMNVFLTERRRKLDALKKYLNQLSVAKEAGYSGWTKSDTPMAPQRDQDEETEMTLEVMEQLGRELDSEIEVSLLEFGYSSSSADDMRGKTSVTPLRAGAYESHVRYEQKKPNQSQYERPFKQNQFQKQQQQHQQQQQQQQQQQRQQHVDRSILYQSHPASSSQSYHNPNRVLYNDNRVDLFEFEHYSHPQAAYPDASDIYTKQTNYSDPRSSSLSPNRLSSSSSRRDDQSQPQSQSQWAQTASSVRFNLGAKGIVEDAKNSYHYDRGHPSRDSRLIRGELSDLTNRRAQTTDALDTHAR